MHRYRVKLAAVALAGAATLAGAESERDWEYRMVPWAEVSDRHVSELARIARERDPGSWYYAEGPHVIGYAHKIRDLDVAMSQAEFAHKEIGRLLKVSDTARKAHVILIYDEEAWSDLVRNAGLRPDGLALQKGREIFLKASSPLHVSRIPHELVHFRLRESYGRIPLWLDEGLAMHFGWIIAKSWSDSQKVTIARSQPGIAAGLQLGLDELTELREYPDGAGAAQAFYRQSEEMARAIVERVGLSKAGDFLAAVAGDRVPWRTALAERFQWSDRDFSELEARVQRRSGESRED